MSDNLMALRLFVRVAQSGSFSRTAREMEISQSTVSRLVAELEERLGGTLLVRNTRAITLTDAGEEYLAKIAPILEALEAADNAVLGDGNLRGVLRVGISSITASRVIVPRIGRFIALHPSLKIELLVDDRRQHLIADNVDVAMRTGKLEDSSAIARRIGGWPLVLAAAPIYIEQHGAPIRPKDLSSHTFVVAGPAAGKGLTLSRGNEEVSVALAGNLSISGTEVAITAGSAGLGIVAASQPSLERELITGELVRLLPDWNAGSVEAYAMFPSGQAPKPAARAFVDFLVSELRS